MFVATFTEQNKQKHVNCNEIDILRAEIKGIKEKI